MEKNLVLLEKKYVLQYIRDLINNIRLGNESVNNAKYHHNSSYKNAPSICKNGILTIKDLERLKIEEYSKEVLEKMSDIESHANGNDCISLAVVGLNDLYPHEDVYDPFNSISVDFLVTSDLPASRYSINYGNEYLSHESIGIDKLRAVDVRILKLIYLLSNNAETIKEVVDCYNYLRNIALAMKNSQLDIPLREMSYKDGFAMDKDKLSTAPKLVLR